MQAVLPSEFKRGMVLMLGGVPQVLEGFHTSGTAQTKPKLHARLRHLRTGRLIDHTFSEGERVPLADVQHRRVQFSYHVGEEFVFSDVETFEELNLSAEQIGERHWFIKENEEYRALFLEGRVVDYATPDCNAAGSGYRYTHPRWFRRHLEARPARHWPGSHGPALRRPRRKNPRGHDRAQICWTRK